LSWFGHQFVIVGGLAELAGDDLFNVSVIVDASGLRAAYRKAHLWDAEPDFFSRGTSRPPVVDTAVGRVATVVCYDLEFPEWTRLPALDGADVLAVPTNWPAEPTRLVPTPAEVVKAQATAMVNRMAVVAADRCGAERGVEWVGGSAVIGADGQLLAGPSAMAVPAVHVAEVDLGTRARSNPASAPRPLAARRPRPRRYADRLRHVELRRLHRPARRRSVEVAARVLAVQADGQEITTIQGLAER
jgi:predicted amidohydrolase